MQKFKFIAVITLSLMLTGCSPFLVKKDEPIIINNSTGLSENQVLLNDTENKNDVLIRGINSNLTDGLIYDLSNDGKLLLLGEATSVIGGNVDTSKTYSNLHTYNLQNKQLKQILLSSKGQTNALFDRKNHGMIYVEYNKDKDDKAVRNSYRLNWTDDKGNTTKNISIADESVSPKFSMVNDELIVYGNTEGQIKIVKLRDITEETITRKTFHLSEKLNIYKVDYYQDYNLAFFLALNPKTKVTDLYYTLLNGSDVEPILLQKNVTDFDISPKNKSVLFHISGEKTSQLATIDMYYNKKIIYEGPVSMFQYTPSEEKIVFSERVDESSNNQNLWIMKSDGSKVMQLGSNLKIAGDTLFFSRNENEVYFSVYHLENKDSNILSYKVYTIDFTYN